MPPASQAIPAPEETFVRALTEAQLPLRAYCEAALGRGEDSKDAWQRTNVALWRKSSSWNSDTPFLSWALAFAKFEVLSVIRDRGREKILFDSDVAELMAEAALQRVDSVTERRDHLASCLQKLSDRQREMLHLHYSAGFSIAEIADSQKMGVSAVKVFLLRVRRVLAECIQQQENKEVHA